MMNEGGMGKGLEIKRKGEKNKTEAGEAATEIGSSGRVFSRWL